MSRRTSLVVGSVAAVVLGAVAAHATPSNEELADALAELRAQNAALQEQVESLTGEVRSARDQAREARELAVRAEERRPVSASPAVDDGSIYSVPLGSSARLQLLDISLDTLMAAGFSDANDDELLVLQGGDHDPRQRGFTLQNVELSLSGAVDPYFTGEAHLIYFLDTEGESRFELEEAFLTTMQLPFHLEEQGFQIEAGQMFTEFGRINPRHPHEWSWQDQPVIASRLFGEDGMRAPGVRVGWLTPLPWYSEVHLGMQNAKGETMVSFLANDEVFDDRPIGGRPFGDPRVSGLDDFVYLLRWVNGMDASDTVSAQLGLSAVLGPNGTGRDGRTGIYGTDLVVKWQPLSADRGWPFVTWETEFMFRRYRADGFDGCIAFAADGSCASPVRFDPTTLQDFGLYTQVLWGFRRGWEAGVRYEFAGASGRDYMQDSASFFSHDGDGYRDDRHRVSPMLVFHPSEFSRLRVQYNYDRVSHLADRDVHSVWAGVEFFFGAHAAHSY